MVFFSGLGIETSRAEIPAKLKVIGTLALYGSVGGALLGTASMAFGQGPRAIFQGASLGLYAGILFGGYVVFSHSYKKKQIDETYPSGSNSPYQGDDEGLEGEEENRWNPYEMNSYRAEMKKDHWKGRSREKGKSIPLFLNLFHYQF